ncbi:MAG TPA: 4a-hydroxytetrahydrobiopterin dehydratase [Candidatus Paceibacterota bacterium]|nr:4a-hydroxytetrahydrobiopterin dehydratase [Candidatus Paceibacterota bacterium]
MIIDNLSKGHCVPCEGGMPPLDHEYVQKYSAQVPEWNVSGDEKKLSREFTFKDFVQAMKFVNAVADVAQAEGHHPDIYIFYNKVRFDLTTHAMGGLSENDFILAAKIDQIKPL